MSDAARHALHPVEPRGHALPDGAPARCRMLPARRLRTLRGGAALPAAYGRTGTGRRTGVGPHAPRAPRPMPGLRIPAASRPRANRTAPAPRPLGPRARRTDALPLLRPADRRNAAEVLRRRVLERLGRLVPSAGARRACGSLTRPDAGQVPQRPPRGCAKPGCPELVYVGARCAAHERALRAEIDSLRPSAARRGYDAVWRRIRLAHLRREPLCRFCAACGLATPATDVDHIVALADGGTHAASNLRSLCHYCHSARTARDQAFGRRPGGTPR